MMTDLTKHIRSVPDYPCQGVVFRDVTTLLNNPRAFGEAVDELVDRWLGSGIDIVAGIEARGFIFAGAVAHRLGSGFVPVRKSGKLPCDTVRAHYSLEYGTDQLEMHVDALNGGERVLLVDDLIATGGTAAAAIELLRSRGAELLGACFVINIAALGGAGKLAAEGISVHTLVSF